MPSTIFLSHWFASTKNQTPDLRHSRAVVCPFGSTRELGVQCSTHSAILSYNKSKLIYPFSFILVFMSYKYSWSYQAFDRMHSRQFYSAAPLGNQATSTMNQYPTQPHYPDTEPYGPCSILGMLSAKLGNENLSIVYAIVLTQQDSKSLPST